MREWVMYFGRNTPNGVVTEREWAEFEEAVLVANFPHGFTVQDGNGLYRNAAGHAVREGTKIVTVYGEAPETLAVHRVVQAYKRMFEQESVLVVSRSDVPVTFT
jgi:hypothetical protein